MLVACGRKPKGEVKENLGVYTNGHVCRGGFSVSIDMQTCGQKHQSMKKKSIEVFKCSPKPSKISNQLAGFAASPSD